MKPQKLIITALTLLAALPMSAQNNKSPNVLDIPEAAARQPIIFPESFEMDTQKMMEGWYLRNYTATDDRYKTMSDPNTPDDVIIKRLADMQTVVEMPFNPVVKTYIERYTKKGRAQVAVLLGLANYYMPIFEQALEEQGLPLELKYLPVIESGLNPNAVSKHGAAGLWQFILATANGMGMQVNSLVDERRDPYLSSAKAAALLKQLYEAYGDWSLAITAYNCGSTNLNKAIVRAGGDPKKHDYWSVRPYLSAESSGYFPAFIAANYVMTYYKDHNISPVLQTKPLVTDTVCVDRYIYFDQISNVLQIPMEELRVLNPQFRADIIPGSPERPYYITLPSQQVHAYIMSEDAIAEYDKENHPRRTVVDTDAAANAVAAATPATPVAAEPVAANTDDLPAVEAPEPLAQNMKAEPFSEPLAQAPAKQNATPGKTVMHKVAAGETLASIADQYGVTQGEIKNWNSLRRNAVRPGQQLKIVVPGADNAVAQQVTAAPAVETPAKQAAQTPKAQQPKPKKKEAAPTTHTIQKGETLTHIARKYGCTVDELKKANGLKNDNIRDGKQLTIPKKKSSGRSRRRR